VGLTTWGEDRPAPALRIWSEELDRHGAPPAESLLAQHELMDSTDKVRTLLLAAGYSDPAAQVMAWSDRPTISEFVARHTTLGATSRRLANLDAQEQAAFLVDIHRRLETLTPDNFVDTGDVIVATASANESLHG